MSHRWAYSDPVDFGPLIRALKREIPGSTITRPPMVPGVVVNVDVTALMVHWCGVSDDEAAAVARHVRNELARLTVGHVLGEPGRTPRRRFPNDPHLDAVAREVPRATVFVHEDYSGVLFAIVPVEYEANFVAVVHYSADTDTPEAVAERARSALASMVIERYLDGRKQ